AEDHGHGEEDRGKGEDDEERDRGKRQDGGHRQPEELQARPARAARGASRNIEMDGDPAEAEPRRESAEKNVALTQPVVAVEHPPVEELEIAGAHQIDSGEPLEERVEEPRGETSAR